MIRLNYVVSGQLVRTNEVKKRMQRAVDSFEENGYKNDCDASSEAHGSNEEGCKEKEDESNFTDVGKLGSDRLNSSEARILMDNVSVASSAWVIKNAMSIFESEGIENACGLQTTK